MLSCELWLPWSPWTPSNIFSTQGVYQVLPGFVFPVLLSRNHLTVVSWGNRRAHLICFLSSGFPVLDCPTFSCLENSRLIHFLFFLFWLFQVGEQILCLLLHLGQKWKCNVLIFKVSFRSRIILLPKMYFREDDWKGVSQWLRDEDSPCFRSWWESRGLA